MSEEIQTGTKEWHKARKKNINSTEVSALPGIDANPYESPYELFLRKAGAVQDEVEVNERMRWGTRLQPIIANAIAEDYGLIIRPLMGYRQIPEHRIGSSFDYEINSSSDGPGVLEIKNVDAIAYRNNWQEDGDSIEAPPHIELQLQHEMLVGGYKWGMIGALVGGNTIKTVRRNFDEAVGKVLLRKVAEFWVMVENNAAPAPDFSRDASVIARLYNRSQEGLVIEADEEICALAGMYLGYQDAIKRSEEKRDEFKARLLERIGEAEKVIGENFTISAKEVAPSQGKLITADMVGTYINSRRGFRGFRVTKKEG